MLCKELVGKNSGAVRVESELGKGTTFFFSLPKGERKEYAEASPDAETEGAKLSSESVAGPSPVPGEQKAKTRLLVVEDTMINQQMLILILEKEGFCVSAVNNGRKAVQTLETTPYDLVLMDIEMPEMNGIEATRAIRDPQTRVLDHHIPIVAVTAHTEKENCEEYFNAGMNDCVSKPIQPSELLSVIRKQLSEKDNLRTESAEPVKVTVSGKKVFDKKELLIRVGGDESICKHIAELFTEGMPNQIEKLKAVLNQKDVEQTRLQAHAMKGISANISAHRLYDTVREIEFAAKESDLDKARLLMETLEDEFEKCQSALHDSGLA